MLPVCIAVAVACKQGEVVVQHDYSCLAHMSEAGREQMCVNEASDVKWGRGGLQGSVNGSYFIGVSVNMQEQYFKGVLAGYLGANFMNGPIADWQIDIIKENISHYCEAMIDHSPLSYEQKHQMKQNLEVYIQGVKDEMKAAGRMRMR